MKGSTLSLPTLKWKLLSLTGLSLIKFEEIKYKFVICKKNFPLVNLHSLAYNNFFSWFTAFCSRMKKILCGIRYKKVVSFRYTDLYWCILSLVTAFFNQKEHDKITLKLWYFFIEKVEINFLPDHPYFSFNS